MHTHFTQLYIAGNFPYLTNVTRISGREWVPTHPYSPSEPFSPLSRLCTKLAKQQTVQIHLSNLTCSFCFQCKSLHVVFAILVRLNNPWPNAMFFQFLNVLHYHVLLWKSIPSSAIDYFKSHLLAQHSMNEGESATNFEWCSNQNTTIHKWYIIHTTFTHVLAYKNSKKWSMARIHKFLNCDHLVIFLFL